MLIQTLSDRIIKYSLHNYLHSSCNKLISINIRNYNVLDQLFTTYHTLKDIPRSYVATMK